MFKVSIILSLYNSEKYLKKYFDDALLQKGIENIEFSIVHNEPSKEEIKLIEEYKEKLNIVYQAVPLEGLYTSWNRAIKQSSGEYLACWNVDDLRYYDSIERMVDTLDRNPDIGFTYGDIVIVKKFGEKDGRFVKSKNFTRRLGTTGAIGGPFFMWRKSLIDKVGYFDEQFRSGGDFDYTVRLSIFSSGKKTNGVIGFFLNEGNGLSTKNANLQILERTVIELRYGIWYKIDIDFISKAMNYHINQIFENGKNRMLDDNMFVLTEKRKLWIFLIFYGYLKGKIIRFLQYVKKSLREK